jgi:hypothetical protein
VMKANDSIDFTYAVEIPLPNLAVKKAEKCDFYLSSSQKCSCSKVSVSC